MVGPLFRWVHYLLNGPTDRGATQIPQTGGNDFARMSVSSESKFTRKNVIY